MRLPCLDPSGLPRPGASVLCYNDGMRRGQTLAEYVLVLVLLMGAAAAAGLVVRAVRAQSARTATLLGSDYP